MKKEKEEKKAALKKEKEEKKEALKKEKAAEKAAKKAANKAAKKAENKAENKAAKKEGVRETQSPDDELQSEKYVEEGAELEVRMFEHEGVQWLKDDNNVLYSPETHKEVARWDPEEQAVMV